MIEPDAPDLPPQPRTTGGRFAPVATALERFLAKCRFEPSTGCVIWCGGKTRGRGKTAWYGAFWDGRKKVYAHRWAAENILGMEIDGKEVDHCCPLGPNTLCVRHLQPVPGRVNTALYWIRVQVGLEPAPEPAQRDPDGIPWYDPPPWFPTPPAPSEPPF